MEVVDFIMLKRPGREANYSPPPTAEVKNALRCTRVYLKVKTESITKYTLTTINTR
jgi:hypothetical protein